MSRVRRSILAITTAAACLSACGTPTTSPQPATGTPTTTPHRADAATVALAKAGLFSSADVGTNWTVTAAAVEYPPVTGGCGSPPTTTLLSSLPAGASQGSAQFRYKDSQWYVGSSSTVFATEADATAWIDTVRKTDAFVQCRRKELEKPQQDIDPKWSYRVQANTSPLIGQNGFGAYTLFQSQYDQGKGPVDANGWTSLSAYHVGRVLITYSLSVVNGATDPKDLNVLVSADVDRALKKAYDRIQTLERAS